MSVKNKETSSMTKHVWVLAKLLTKTYVLTTLGKRDLDIADLAPQFL